VQSPASRPDLGDTNVEVRLNVTLVPSIGKHPHGHQHANSLGPREKQRERPASA